MNANFACTLHRVAVRCSASVWRRRVEKCCVGSLLRLRQDGARHGSVVVFVSVVVVRGFVMLLLRSSYDIFSYCTARTN